jgi:hypothetical protein
MNEACKIAKTALENVQIDTLAYVMLDILGISDNKISLEM